MKPASEKLKHCAIHVAGWWIVLTHLSPGGRVSYWLLTRSNSRLNIRRIDQESVEIIYLVMGYFAEPGVPPIVPMPTHKHGHSNRHHCRRKRGQPPADDIPF